MVRRILHVYGGDPINVDGRTIARATNSAFRAQNALDIERKRRGFSGV